MSDDESNINFQVQQLSRMEDMAGHATACAFSGMKEFMAPEYHHWRVQRLISFAPFLAACFLTTLFLI